MAKIRARKAKASGKANAKREAVASKAVKTKERGALPVKAARAALDRATADIKKWQRSASRNAWAIGHRLAQVAELGLHRARGFSRIEEYAEKQLNLSANVAFQYMRVAQAFSETMVGAFGTEKLDRALRYIAATPEEEKPSDIPKLKFAVPSDDGDSVVQKSFEDVTVDDLRGAIAAARGGSKKSGRKKAPPDWLDEEAAAAIDKSNKALDKAVGAGAARTADVAVRRAGKDVILDVRGVPLERAGAAFKALGRALE